MPQGTVIPQPKFTAYDDNGDPVSGGKLTVYAAGTTTKIDTYANAGLTVPNTNPVILDAGGRATIFLSATSHRFVLTDADDVQIWDVDGITALEGAGSSSGLDAAITSGQDLAANDLGYISDGSGGLAPGRAYKADADLAYASIDAELGFITAEVLSGAGGFQRRGGTLDGFTGLIAGSTYYASTVAGAITATPPANARAVGIALSATTLLIKVSPARPDVISGLVCQGRLTIASGVPVSAVDLLAKTTLYFCPDKGNRVDCFDTVRWNRRTFSELSIALPAVANQLYDVFLVDTAGVLSLELNAWRNSGQAVTGATNATPIVITAVAHGLSNGDEVYISGVKGNTAANGTWIVANKAADTFELTTSVGNGAYTASTGYLNARASTGLLVKQDGVYLKTAALTRRYLGTCRTTGVAGQTEDSVLNRLVWNYGQRARRLLRVLEPTNTWTYSTHTWRQANAAAGNKFSIVVGVADNVIEVEALAVATHSIAGNYGAIGIGEDSVTTPKEGCLMGQVNAPVATYQFMLRATLKTIPTPGFHAYSWLEIGNGTGTLTWSGDGGTPDELQSGLHGTWES